MLELVIGGARSGKSAYAEQCAENSKLAIHYIATATAGDAEMQQRIAFHRNSRPKNWLTTEEPIHLGKAIALHSDVFVIVDCLTLWMSNVLALESKNYQQEVSHFFSSIENIITPIIFVTNEIGMGVVPLGEETRRFIDETGRLHQRLAKRCQRVTQMIAGIEHRIKDE